LSVRVATRYKKAAQNDIAILTIAARAVRSLEKCTARQDPALPDKLSPHKIL
jgi:hypothetical protein